MKSESRCRELPGLKEDILKMGRLLQEQVQKAVTALATKDIELAREVIQNDDQIDQMELDIEQKCLKLIALKQPMARDLRFIATILRIIVDIERMADHAEDISKVCINLYQEKYIKPLIDIPRMADIVRDMIERGLNALISEDGELAISLVPLEKEMDDLYTQIFRELLSYMMQDPRTISQAISLLLAAGHLERIADHATNIGEMVIYVVEGKRIDLNEIAHQ